LRTLLDEHVEQLPANADGSPAKQFARVRMDPGKACPLLGEDKLCRIQAEQGTDFLSVTCATYPRIRHVIDGLEEKALSLSCPEAARVVLLSPDLLAARSGPRYQFVWIDASVASEAVPLIGYFWPIREFVLGLLTNRNYMVWQRLFLLGVFTRRLDMMAAKPNSSAGGGFRSFLVDFAAATDSDSLRASMDAIPADLGLQLGMVLRLAGLRLPRSHVSGRFLSMIEVFRKGIGYGPEASMESLIASYRADHDEYFRPFFREHPQILENLLINAVFRSLFPFGHVDGKPNSVPQMQREFAMLALQFSLIKGLLIGVAGHRREAFSVEHVIETVQSASKHFEHHPAFVDEAYALLSGAQLDNVRGLTLLLRN
jgi:lysine-N-methylase